jgi:hypothetical protein
MKVLSAKNNQRLQRPNSAACERGHFNWLEHVVLVVPLSGIFALRALCLRFRLALCLWRRNPAIVDPNDVLIIAEALAYQSIM